MTPDLQWPAPLCWRDGKPVYRVKAVSMPSTDEASRQVGSEVTPSEPLIIDLTIPLFLRRT